jgi:hypothetical protein
MTQLFMPICNFAIATLPAVLFYDWIFFSNFIVDSPISTERPKFLQNLLSIQCSLQYGIFVHPPSIGPVDPKIVCHKINTNYKFVYF